MLVTLCLTSALFSLSEAVFQIDNAESLITKHVMDSKFQEIWFEFMRYVA